MNKKSKKIKEVISYILTASIIIYCFTFLPISVSVAAPTNSYANISVFIDYENETITLSGNDSTKDVKYMYSPNATATTLARKLAAEKWYPIYGDVLNISRFIPKNETSEILFAFRDADELPNSDGTYSSRILSNKNGKSINGRPNISQNVFKSSARYDSLSETIKISGDLLSGYDYRIGDGNWITNKTNSSINVSSKYNSLGGTVIIRKSAVAGSSFASNEYKAKIPKAPNRPNVRVNDKSQRLVGIITGTNGYAWSSSENGQYILFKDRILDLSDFEKEMGQPLSSFEQESNIVKPGESNIVNAKEDYIILYIKILANEKRPSSPVQKLYIEKSLIEKSMKY